MAQPLPVPILIPSGDRKQPEERAPPSEKKHEQPKTAKAKKRVVDEAFLAQVRSELFL